MQLSISHETQYTYQEPVNYALQQLRLTPKNRSGQNVVHWDIEVDGGTIELSFDDQNNNRVSLVKSDTDAQSISIRAFGTVETQDKAGIIGQHGGYLPLWYFNRQTALTKPGKIINSLVREHREFVEKPLECLHMLSGNILEKVAYKVGGTTADTTAEEAMQNGSGVCQDHTHIFVSSARQLGFPARYVSGYLMLNDSIEQDASHAWAETFIPDLGWVGFDISNGISPDGKYIPVATGLDYLETAPISGM